MLNRIIKINPDSAGFFTSLLCAIHCSAVPVLMSLGLIGTGSWLHNHAFDWVVIGIGIVIAGYSIVGDFFRRHRNIRPLITALVGFLFLFTGMVEHHGWMLVFSVIGGLLVAYSHILNFRYGGSCSVKQPGYLTLKSPQD
ncbi:MAG: MerC domain-containing protein [Saprospiraceae bacterium]|nr:MerC domain-containing protein [Saprospiraceae bacterium]